jgi:uncharacterized LabA/DUF88 family protein
MGYNPAPSALSNKFMILADGENLVFRYQEMLATGKKPNASVIHIPDTFVWHPNLPIIQNWYATRVNYYTSAVASDDKIAELEGKISNTTVYRRLEPETQICPRVFKKEKKSKKTKIVDISLCIDALRHSYHRHVEGILILSGDADFLPLIREVMRNGTQVWAGAFSVGLSPRIPSAVDRFKCIDSHFFEPE